MNSLDLKIENALSAGTISIWYQPIYNRETNTFDAAEALMRLYNPYGRENPRFQP